MNKEFIKRMRNPPHKYKKTNQDIMDSPTIQGDLNKMG